MTTTAVRLFPGLGAQLAPVMARFADLEAQLAEVGRAIAAIAADLIEYRASRRATWEARREAVHARRIAAVRALVTATRRRLDALYVAELVAGRPTDYRRFDLEAPSPPPLYVASLVRVPNAPPPLAAFVPMGETT